MLQVTQAKCLIFTSARHWLYSFPWLSRDQPGSPSGSWAWTIPALSQPPWDHHNCCGCGGFLLFMYHFESTGLSNVLTSPIPYQTVPFYYPECLLKIFGSRAFGTGTVLQDTAVQYPSWVGERKLLPTLSELLKFGFIFKLCPKTIIPAYFKFLVRFFFPSWKKTSRNDYKVDMRQENNRYRKRPEEEGERKDCINKATD